MKNLIQAVRGMNDILPDAAPLWDYFDEVVRAWLDAYGYRSIRLPLVEQTDLFKRSVGEVTDIVEKEMYTFVDHLSGESLSLRPEGTASCVRACLQHNLLYNGPQRLYYDGPMFRHERPQKGRYRQFHQVGVEALGFGDPQMDAEHMIMTARLWRLLGLGAVTLQINTLGSAACRARYRGKLVDYFLAHGTQLDEDSTRRLHTNPLRILDSKNPALQALIEAAPRLFDEIDHESARHFEAVKMLLTAAGVPFEVNPRLVRGLDYYNHTVFEWVTSELGAQGTICAGGRYDGLIEQLGGKPTPACGFAMGVERLILLLQQKEFAPPIRSPHVYVVHQGEAATLQALQAAEQLREAGLRVVLHCGGGSFKAQMKKADGSGARFALILGEDEVAAGLVTLKPLREDALQVRCSVEDAMRRIAQSASGNL